MRRWVLLALAAVVTLLLVGCCCSRRGVLIGPAHRLPPPSALALPTPSVVLAPSDSTTEVVMRSVYFHLDDDIVLRIRELRGTMRGLHGTQFVNLDDKNALLLEIGSATVALSARGLTLLLNRYVFSYPGSPLHDVVVTTKGNQIVQTGVMHEVIDIPFTMTATLSVTDEGDIRIHSTSMRICGLDGKGLLKAVGATLEDVLDLSGATGVRVEGNDLILKPLAILPPPKITGRLTGIRVVGNEIVQIFGDPDAAGVEALPPPVPAKNYVYFRGGTVKFGKLYMVLADLEAVDSDPTDPFDFYLDYYNSQLVAGYHVTLPSYTLVAFMPDFDDLGMPRGHARPPAGDPEGESSAPSTSAP